MAVLTFDDDSSCFFTDDQPDYREDWAICGWFRMDADHGAFVFGHNKTNSSPGDQMMTYSRNAAFDRVNVNAGGTTADSANDTVVVGDWHHAACVHDAAADTFAGYLDAVQFGSVSVNASAWPATSVQRIWVGGDGLGGTSPFFVGDKTMEQVKMWDATLTAAEIAAEMRSSEPVRRTNLWAWWHLHPDTTLRVLDYSGNARTLSLSGAPGNATDGAPARYRRRKTVSFPSVVVAASAGPVFRIAQPIM